MEEIKDKVIVISSVNVKEKDKQVTLFSLENGVIKAMLKGVNQPKSKFKFLGQPFCFAEVVMVKRGNFYTVTQAYPQESFYKLTTNLDKYYLASCVLEVLKTFSLTEENYPEIFVLALKCFKELEFEEVIPEVVVIKFLLEVFKLAGYQLRLTSCHNCGSKVLTTPYFDFTTGSVLCLSCKNQYSIEISKPVLNLLRLVNETEFARLKTLRFTPSQLQTTLGLLKMAYQERLGVKLKSF